jgi:tRNA (guanine37-N1)-methyltransferase
MKFTVLTIFPEMLDPFWSHGIIRRAIRAGKISVSALDIRQFAEGRHRVTDDRPYGGGDGMVMKPEPLAAAIREARRRAPSSRTILLSPQGMAFSQQVAAELATFEGLIFVCGRYEGVDERICQDFADFDISIGDYVLTGGELPAMVIIDAVTRLIPGVLGGAESAQKDSFSQDLLEHGHYTRPRQFEGQEVPEVLLSGNHREIERWRREASLIRTLLKRSDLLVDRPLDKGQIEILRRWYREIEKIIDAQDLFGPGSLSGGQ